MTLRSGLTCNIFAIVSLVRAVDSGPLNEDDNAQADVTVVVNTILDELGQAVAGE